MENLYNFILDFLQEQTGTISTVIVIVSVAILVAFRVFKAEVNKFVESTETEIDNEALDIIVALAEEIATQKVNSIFDPEDRSTVTIAEDENGNLVQLDEKTDY